MGGNVCEQAGLMVLAVTTCAQFMLQYGFQHPLDAARHQTLLCTLEFFALVSRIALLSIHYFFCEYMRIHT
jgi:hypothetical protein